MALDSISADKLLPDRNAATELNGLPDWYPPWAHELAHLYFSGSTCLFILHGNVHDLIQCRDGDEERYCDLVEFLGSSVFGTWDVVLRHDLGHGIRPLAGTSRERLQSMIQFLTKGLGSPSNWPRNPDDVLLAIDQLIERNLLQQESGNTKSLGLIFEYAQYLVPASDLESLAVRHASRLVRLLEWSQNPYIKRVNTAFCLIADKLSEVNDRLVQCPHVAAIEVPMPDREARYQFVQSPRLGESVTELTDYSADQLADLSNGMTLINLNLLLAQAVRSGRKIDAGRFRELKKSMIERQCQGLLEFIEPKHTLELIVGHEAAKQRLREDAGFIAAGRFGAAPMGYLLCGPVGTGKTFLAECYAGSIGIPCVKLRNFRSKYVGETEGNLERILSVLRSLGPVVVMIDEADAALGTRHAEGDSGTSSRVFSMIASQMGDTSYRGRIIWMLMTSRPDFLPIDLKRQGRAEVHIPLFYPHGEAEIREMFVVMARKNKMKLSPEAVPATATERNLSGADIESIVLSAMRQTLKEERTELSAEDIQASFENFIPSAQGLEKEAQEIAAVLECTDMSFLTPHWRDVVKSPNGRSELQNRLVAIRQLIDEYM